MDYKWLIEELRRIYTFSGEWMVDGKEKWALEAAAKAIETLLAERDKIRCRMTPLALERYNRGIFGCLEVCDVSERDQGGWRRVTPETMPPDMVPVFVSITHDYGGGAIGKWVDAQVRYNPDNGWEYLCDAYNLRWTYYSSSKEITHWMPYPEPAED